MCPKLTQYETHKYYIAGSLKPWSPSASWVRGVSMGGPIALWTKDYNGFCDVSCSPLQRLAWLKAVSHNGTCSRPSDVAWKSFRENDFKIDYLFYTTNIGGHWCLQSYLTSYCEKRLGILVLWIWSNRTRTQTKVLVLMLSKVLVLVLRICVLAPTLHHFKAISEFKLELQSGNTKVVSRFIAIGPFKLELPSGNAKFRSKSAIFCTVWPWNLTDDLEKQ